MENTYPVSNKKLKEHDVDERAHDVRFKAIENDYEKQIGTERERAEGVESDLSAAIGVLNGDDKVEGSVAYAVKAEADRASGVEAGLQENITTQVKFLTSVDEGLQTAITALTTELGKEIDRSTGEDTNLTTQITGHIADTNLHYSGLPIGSVIWWQGLAEKRPAGFLLLDGSTYDTTLYPELYTDIVI